MTYTCKIETGKAMTFSRGIEAIAVYHARVYWKKKLCVRVDTWTTRKAAVKAGEAMAARYTVYLRRTGKRYEVELAEKRATKKAAAARRQVIRAHAVDLHDAAKKALRLSRPTAADLSEVMLKIDADITSATEEAREKIMGQYQ